MKLRLKNSLNFEAYFGKSNSGEYWVLSFDDARGTKEIYLKKNDIALFFDSLKQTWQEYERVKNTFVSYREGDCKHEHDLVENREDKNGKKMVARLCRDCGKFLDWAKQKSDPRDFVLFAGQYKNKTVGEVIDKYPGYAKWAKDNMSIYPKIQEKFKEAMNEQPGNS